MTDLMPEVAREVESPPASGCTADKHGRSEHAWQRWGCRCPAAVAAHERRNEQKREGNIRLPAQVDEDGRCVARTHDSARAWRRGCRCPESIAKHTAALQREREKGRGPQYAPPWEFWRGPDMRVYRWNLFLLMHSFLGDEPTRGELIAAVHILTGSPSRRDAGMTAAEMATILKVSRVEIWNAGDDIRRFRKDRWRRRLADVKLRAHRRGRAVERGRGHDRSGHPVHPWWLALAYDRMTSTPKPPEVRDA